MCDSILVVFLDPFAIFNFLFQKMEFHRISEVSIAIFLHEVIMKQKNYIHIMRSHVRPYPKKWMENLKFLIMNHTLEHVARQF
jgi:hypothetical protein